jgi:membrane protease YdiL (CAAX protease family)
LYEGGVRGLQQLIGQLTRWQVNPGWYLVALLGAPTIGIAGRALSHLIGRPAPGPWLILPSIGTVGVAILAAVAQELGWRGYAFARLQNSVGGLAASILIGIVWFLWREWILILPGGRFLLIPFGLVLTLLYLIAASIAIGWLYNRTNGSLPVACAANAGMLLMADIVVVHFVQYAFIACLAALAAGVVLLLDGPGSLGRRYNFVRESP